METKFTPWPWFVVDKSTYHGYYVKNNDGESICDLYFKATLTNEVCDHGFSAKQNAHLIAAAPEMYETLDSMIKQFEYDGCTEYEFKLLASAKKTLAKARGEK